MLDTRPEPHDYAELNRASNLQICIVCSDHLPLKRPSFIIFNGAERRTRILRTRYGAKKPEVELRYSDGMHKSIRDK